LRGCRPKGLGGTRDFFGFSYLVAILARASHPQRDLRLLVGVAHGGDAFRIGGEWGDAGALDLQ